MFILLKSCLLELRTRVMVEKCLGQNDVVTCPKPSRQLIRYALFTNSFSNLNYVRNYNFSDEMGGNLWAFLTFAAILKN